MAARRAVFLLDETLRHNFIMHRLIAEFNKREVVTEHIIAIYVFGYFFAVHLKADLTVRL